jgi:hypothetical protein
MSLDISQPASGTQSIQVQFSPSIVSSVTEKDGYLSGRLMTDSASPTNVTLFTNNMPTNSFTATAFYVVGSMNPTSTTALTSFKRGEAAYLTKDPPEHGELIIDGIDQNTQDKMRLCFLLFTSKTENNSLTALLQGNTITTIDFGSAIAGAFADAKKTPTVQQSYITYKANPFTYVVCTVPVYVNATLAFTNPFNLGALDLKTTVISAVDDAQWMECDYASVGAEAVNVMQVPVSSVGDLNAEQSFRQLILFFVFLIFLLVFYFVIPPLYQMLLWKLAANDPNAMCTVMQYLDLGYNVVLGFLWITLLFVGVTSQETNAPQVLQSSLIIGVMQLIIYGTITVSKMSPNFPFENREQRCTPKPIK